jgi:hypothetical protein
MFDGKDKQREKRERGRRENRKPEEMKHRKAALGPLRRKTERETGSKLWPCWLKGVGG